MKRIYKVLLSLAALLLVGGGIMGAAGWAMGGQTSMTVNFDGHPTVFGYRSNRKTADGAFAGTEENRNLPDFTKIEVDIDWGDVQIEAADTPGVALAWNSESSRMHYTCEKGTLKVWNSSDVQLFGINADQPGGTAIIYLPSSMQPDEVTVKNSMGRVTLADFTADKLTVTADAGNVSCANLKLGTAEITLDAGGLTLTNVAAERLEAALDMGGMVASGLDTAKSLTVKSNLGEVTLDGTLRGKTDVTADMGDVIVTTALPERDYTCNLSVDLGKLQVDGVARDGSRYARDGGGNTLTVAADLGNVEVNFKR